MKIYYNKFSWLYSSPNKEQAIFKHQAKQKYTLASLKNNNKYLNESEEERRKKEPCFGDHLCGT